MENKKLYRSRQDRIIAGICGGLGQYLGIDPTIIRVLFVLFSLPGAGTGIILYALMWVAIPREPEVPLS